MQVVRRGGRRIDASLPPCKRWALDLARIGEISGGAAKMYKEAVCMLGGKCVYPGCTVADHDMLTIAHRDGNGGQHRKMFAHSYITTFTDYQQARPSDNYYGDIIRDVREGRGDRYMLLCANHHKKLDAVSRREKRRAT